MKFGNTKWDVRDWSERQKVQFQEKCFELGYGWLHTGKGKYEKGFDSIYINKVGYITFMMSDFNYFKSISHTEKTWEDMFPTPKLDVSKEIATLVFEALDKMEGEVIQEEDGNGFDNLEFMQIPQLGASIRLDRLSEDQLVYITNMFDLPPRDIGFTHITFNPEVEIIAGRVVAPSKNDEVFYTIPAEAYKPCFNLSFNDFFKEV